MSSALTASSFNSAALGVSASTSAVLYQRTAYNAVGATAAKAVNIGQLTPNQTQLDVVSTVIPTNQNDYYTFNFQGNSPLKLSFSNLTNTDNLRFQLLDSSGNVVADSQGTATQQVAYIQLTTSGGLKTASGQYSVRVNYAPISNKATQQNYSFSLYSGSSFTSSYQTTAVAQASSNSLLPVDNTLTFATSDAALFTRQGFNQIGETASTGVNIGWISANKSRLDVQSQLTTADPTDFYQLTLQKGGNLKLAFNNTTGTTPVRVQLLNATGTHVIADSGGNTALQAAYASLTSSNGLSAKPGQYSVKVSYATNANHSKTQNYNFQVYSGDVYASSYQTFASAQTIGNAILTGNPNVVGFSSASAAASYLNSLSQGTAPDILTTLSTLV